ncbi:MAG: hypothetical protein ACJ76H_03210 [Bacteriovoracaceae bacterium]
MQKLKAFIAILLTVVTLTHSKPSQAAVGAAFSTPVLIAGLAIGGVGVVGSVIGLAKCNQQSGDSAAWCGVIVVLLGVPVVLIGLVVLDGEQQLSFRELNNNEAAKIGVSAQELAVYNSEIDQANMLLSNVKEDLSAINNPTEKDSINAWSSVRDLVSPETYSVMQKIASQK